MRHSGYSFDWEWPLRCIVRTDRWGVTKGSLMAAARNPAVAEEEFPRRLPAQLVQDFHAAFGEHHARAVHTKGLILQGTYTPSAEARGLCPGALQSQDWR
jgi:hypothetical protein